LLKQRCCLLAVNLDLFFGKVDQGLDVCETPFDALFDRAEFLRERPA